MADLEPWDPLEHPARIEVRRQESDDSDAEGGLGNVTRVVLRPPGHSGKAKRGHLCFDASFETGNLGRVDFISEFEYDLFIRPDTCNPRYRLWFNFVVDNVRVDQRVIFNLVNLCKVKTLFRDGMTPLVRTSSRPKWQRLPQKYVYYHRSPEHRNHYILSFAFSFDREEDVYQFSFSYPYSYSRCQAHLGLVEEKDLPFVKRESLAPSLQNRRVEALTISKIVPTMTGGKKPKLVVILARTHPGESPTSFVAQGLIDFLVSSNATVAALRDHVIIKILPMVNPDGVFLGNHRCSLMGYDLNRHWNQVSPWAHPTLNAVKNHLLDLDASKVVDLDLVIDLHAHSSLSGAFIYGNSYDDVYRFERHILFPKLLAHNAEDFTPSNTMYNRDTSKAGTARRHLCELLRPAVNTYTVQVSFYGYTQQTTNLFVPYNEDGYFRFGRNLVRTLFEYYRVTGIIPANILAPVVAAAEPEKKPKRLKSRSRSRSLPRSKGSQGKLKADKSKDPSFSSSVEKARESPGKESSSGRQTALGHLEDPNSQPSTEKAVVQLSRLTQEARRESSDSSCEEEYSNRDPLPTRSRSLSRKNSSAIQATDHQETLSRPEIPSGPSDSEQENTVGIRKVRVRRKTVEARNQLRAKTATYRTFDFSTIDSLPNYYHFKSAHRERTNRKNPKMESRRGRKIGGGGIIGHSKEIHSQRRRHTDDKGWHSEPESNAPFLTIIDFNRLIHKSLTDAVTSGTNWSGIKANYKRWIPPYSANSSRLTNVPLNVESITPLPVVHPAQPNDTNAAASVPSSDPSSTKRRHRRRAVAFHESVSDYSTWDGYGSHGNFKRISYTDSSPESDGTGTDSDGNHGWNRYPRRRRALPVERCLRTPSPVSPVLNCS